MSLLCSVASAKIYGFTSPMFINDSIVTLGSHISLSSVSYTMHTSLFDTHRLLLAVH